MMINKVTTLTEAVKLVHEGDTLALGGMTLYRRPVAFVRELIRQGRPFGNPATSPFDSAQDKLRAGLRTGDLTLLAFTASFASDLLVGAGMVSRGTFSVSLPKSGPWLEWIRSAFGVVMLVTAFYYLRNLIPGFTSLVERTPSFLISVLGAVVAGIALGAIHLSFHDGSIARRCRKSVGIALTVFGLIGVIGYLESLPPGAKIEWTEDYHAAKARARQQRRPFLVDFGASWCAACGELDRLTFSDPKVVREARRFIAVRIDLSPGSDSEEKRSILAAYRQVGLPLVVLHDRAGREVARLTTFIDADAFLEIMRRVQ